MYLNAISLNVSPDLTITKLLLTEGVVELGTFIVVLSDKNISSVK